MEKNIKEKESVLVVVVDNGKPASDGYSIGDNATITGFTNQ